MNQPIRASQMPVEPGRRRRHLSPTVWIENRLSGYYACLQHPDGVTTMQKYASRAGALRRAKNWAGLA